MVGVLGYLGYLHATAGRTVDPGPTLAGRPLPWLVLRLLAVVTVAAVVAVVLRRRPAGTTGEHARAGLLIAAGADFVPWAVYWGLLLP